MTEFMKLIDMLREGYNSPLCEESPKTQTVTITWPDGRTESYTRRVTRREREAWAAWQRAYFENRSLTVS